MSSLLNLPIACIGGSILTIFFTHPNMIVQVAANVALPHHFLNQRHCGFFQSFNVGWLNPFIGGRPPPLIANDDFSLHGFDSEFPA